MTTLTQLNTRARQLADLVGSSFIEDAEWTTYINLGLQELYDIVVASFEDYFTVAASQTITTGNTLALPATFYKLRGLDFAINGSTGDWVNVRQFNFNERNWQAQWRANAWANESSRRYRIIGNSLYITPEDKAPGTYQLWYVPSVTPLSAGGDTISTSLSQYGWDEYIALFAAIKAQLKSESDTSEYVRQKNEIAARIISMAANRNIDQPDRITDLTGGGFNGWDGGPFYD